MIAGGLTHTIQALTDEVVSRGLPLRGVLRHLRAEIVKATLRRESGNVSKAAKRLQVHRNTLARIAERS